MIDYRVDFERMEWDEPMAGVRHKFVVQDGTILRLVEYSKAMEPHWCNRGHFGMILEGQFEIRYDNCTLVYNPGDGVFIPSGEENRHMAVSLTDKVRALFVEEA
jgi:ethanolamine utilization protein EutQ (cupin superfamily)